MDTKPQWALKVGGSLEKENVLGKIRGERGLLSIITELSGEFNLLIIPGGGVFADFVRDRATQCRVPDSVAHAQAILAMAQFGYELAEKIEGAKIALYAAEVKKLWAEGKIPVFIPYPYILDDRKIPACWDATSDTIAARVCHYLDIKKLTLLKSVDGISVKGELLREVSMKNTPDTNVVDSEFFKHIGPRLETFIINGRKPERLKELLFTGSTMGTRLHG